MNMQKSSYAILIGMVSCLLISSISSACWPPPSPGPCYEWNEETQEWEYAGCNPACQGSCKSCNEDCSGCEDDSDKCYFCDNCVNGTCISTCSVCQKCVLDNPNTMTYKCVSDCQDPCQDCVMGVCEGGCDASICEECFEWSLGSYDCDYACTGCETCIGGACVDTDSECTGDCMECVDATCVFACTTPPNLYCRASDDTCIECSPDAGAACSVTAEELGYDPDDCESNTSGNGSCIKHGAIMFYSQTSTDTHATGSGTEDATGCADVTYSNCKTVLAELPLTFECIWDPSTQTTENMGTHKECP